jgi:hypothetical protein
VSGAAILFAESFTHFTVIVSSPVALEKVTFFYSLQIRSFEIKLYQLETSNYTCYYGMFLLSQT